jgi:hypothetical protein
MAAPSFGTVTGVESGEADTGEAVTADDGGAPVV